MSRYSIQKRDNLPQEGSVYNVANRQNMKIEEILANADVIVLVDVSGSMDQQVIPGKSRWDLAQEALNNLQRKYQGRLIIVSFHTTQRLCLDGNLERPTGGTNLKGALEYVKEYDGAGMKFIIISDGCPDDPEGAIAVARAFVDQIDVIFIGTDYDQRGRDYLQRLATGQFLGKDDVRQLSQNVTLLLEEKK